MIVMGQTPQPDAALKILTPWWDVLCRYLSGAIMTIALTATAFQAAKDTLVCIPAVDCTRNSLPTEPRALKLKMDVCDQVQYHVINNDTTTTIMTTMNDYRSYSYVDSECFQRSLEWYPAYFPFILVVQALVLLIIDNFWVMYPKTTAALSHFVALVKDCYESVGTLSDIIAVIKASEKDSDAGSSPPKEKSKETHTEDIEMAIVDPNKPSDESDKPSGSQLAQAIQHVPLDMAEAVKVKMLYKRVENFKKWHDGSNVFTKVYVLRGIGQVLFTSGVLVFIAWFYSSLSESINCRLQKLFIMKYEYFVCSRFIAQYYKAFTFIFGIPIGLYFLASLWAFIWTFRNSARFNLYSGIQFVDKDLKVKGDLAFLFSLLEQYDKLYAVKFSIFLSTDYKEKVEKKISEIYVKNVEEKNEGRFGVLHKLWPKSKAVKASKSKTNSATAPEGAP